MTKPKGRGNYTRYLQSVPNPPDENFNIPAADPDDYREDRFYTLSHNPSDHTSATKVSIHPAFMALARRVIESGKIPEWKTTHDIIRDGAWHRIFNVIERIDEPALQKALALARSMVNEELIEERMEAYSKMVGRISRHMGEVDSIEVPIMRKELIASIAERILLLHEPTRTRFIEEFTEQFGYSPENLPRD